jgi:hypothetical protein
MRWIVGLYPQAWRERYGDEMEALLEDYPLSPLTAADLLLGAAAAHVDQLLVLLRRRRGVPPVTREQVVSLALGVGWLIPWLIVMHAALASVWLPVVGIAFLELAVTRPSAPEVGASVVAAIGLGWITGHVWGGVACGLAAWAGWTAWDPAPRTGLVTRLILVLITLTVLVIARPPWWPALPVASVIGVLGLVEGHRPVDIGHRRWWGLGLTVSLAAVGLALLVYTTLSVVAIGWTPWWPVLPVAVAVGAVGLMGAQRPPAAGRYRLRGRGLAAALAAVCLALVVFSLLAVLVVLLPPGWAVAPLVLGIGSLGWAGRQQPAGVGPPHRWVRRLAVAVGAVVLMVVIYQTGSGREIFAFVPRLGTVRTCAGAICGPVLPAGWISALGLPRIPGSVLVTLVGGSVLLGAGVWGRCWLLREWDPADAAVSAAGPTLERRPVTVPAELPSSLHPTRRVIYHQLRQAARRPYAARPGETVREWAERVYGAAALPAVVLYEEVRYGGMADSSERAAAAARGWPAPRPAERGQRLARWRTSEIGPEPRIRMALRWASLAVFGIAVAATAARAPAVPVMAQERVSHGLTAFRHTETTSDIRLDNVLAAPGSSGGGAPR